jgi:hypothetical protein
MTICPKCGHENPPDRDFCSQCGEYLRWEETVITPPPPRPEPVTGPGVVLTLRLPSNAQGMDPVQIRMTAGSRATVLVQIRNQSGVVDNYDVGVRGLPAGWWTVSPPTAYLVPFGSEGGSYEQELELELRPPSSSDAHASDFEVVARSRARGAVVATARAAVAIAPDQQKPPPPQPPVPPPPVTPRARSRPPWTLPVLVIGLIAIVIAIVIWAAGSGYDPSPDDDSGAISAVITGQDVRVRQEPGNGAGVGIEDELSLGTAVVVECFEPDQDGGPRPWFRLTEPHKGSYVPSGFTDPETAPPQC